MVTKRMCLLLLLCLLGLCKGVLVPRPLSYYGGASPITSGYSYDTRTFQQQVLVTCNNNTSCSLMMEPICSARWTISTTKTTIRLVTVTWLTILGGWKAALSFFILEMKEISRGFATILLVLVFQCVYMLVNGWPCRVLCGTLLHLSKPCWFSLSTVTMAPVCLLVIRVSKYEVTS